MDILFSTGKLRKLCNDQKALRKEHGKRQADLVRRRLDDLEAAERLEVMRHMVGRCHELTGDRAGQLSLDLVHPDRLIFEPADEPVPRKEDGGLDWSRVVAVRIIGVEDTHG